MKKLSFILHCIILVPPLSFFPLDKREAIIDPAQTKTKFIYIFSRKVLANLFSPQKDFFITRFKENSPYLIKSFKYMFFGEYQNSFFRFNFYKEIHQTEEWHKYSFGKLSNVKYHTFAEVLEC